MGWWGIGTYNSGLTVVRGTGWMLSAFMTVRRFCFNSSELRPRLLLEDEAHLASSWKSWWTKDTLRSLKWRKIILVQQDEAKVFKDSELSYSCYSLELAPGGCTAPSHLQLAGPGQNLKRNIQNGAIFFFVTLANYEHCRSWHGSRDLPVWTTRSTANSASRTRALEIISILITGETLETPKLY